MVRVTQSKRLRALCECAIMGALAVVLGLVKFKLAWGHGGSISLILVPIIIISIRYGIGYGLVTGLITGTLDWIIGGCIIAFWAGPFFDYIIAYGVVGVAGIFGTLNKRKIGIYLAPIVGGTLRFLSHYISGIWYYAEYAPEGQSKWLYSLLYNGGYMLGTIIVTVIAMGGLYYYSSTRRYIMGDDLVKSQQNA